MIQFLNAGIMPNSPLSALKTDDWEQTVDVNIKGVLNGVAAVLPTFIEQKSGHVITTSSIYPAAISTELLDDISHEETAEVMEGLYERYGISPDRIANVVAIAIDQPEDTTINEFTVGPANQPW